MFVLDYHRWFANLPFGLRMLDAVDQFRYWWAEEFRSLLKGRYKSLFLEPQRRVLELKFLDDAVEIAMDNGDGDRSLQQAVSPNSASEAVDGLLRSLQLDRSDVDYALILPESAFFKRHFLLPSETRANAHAIAERDIPIKLPFRLDEIFCRTIVTQSSDSTRLDVWQWIIKKRIVEEAALKLMLPLEQISFVYGPLDVDGIPSPLIALPNAKRSTTPWYWSSFLALLIGSVVLAAIAVGLEFWRQSELLDRLNSQIANSRSKARQVRLELDGIEKKRAAIVRVNADKISIPGLLDLLNETTTLLPPHSWLLEFQIQPVGNTQDQQLVLSGYSEAAASLVRQFDRSTMFKDASLTSPVSTDPIESKERFAMQMKIIRIDAGKERPR